MGSLREEKSFLQYLAFHPEEGEGSQQHEQIKTIRIFYFTNEKGISYLVVNFCKLPVANSRRSKIIHGHCYCLVPNLEKEIERRRKEKDKQDFLLQDIETRINFQFLPIKRFKTVK